MVSDSESLLIGSFCSVVTFLGFFFFHEFNEGQRARLKRTIRVGTIYFLFLCNFCLIFSPRVVMGLVFTVADQLF